MMDRTIAREVEDWAGGTPRPEPGPPPEPIPGAVAALDAWLEDNRKGGYAYFEHLEGLCRVLAEQVDMLRTEVDNLRQCVLSAPPLQLATFGGESPRVTFETAEPGGSQ